MDKRRRRSPIWRMSPTEFASLVARSNTAADVLRHFGLQNSGSNWPTVWRRCLEEGVSTTHFNASAARRRTLLSKEPIPLSEILVEHSQYNRSRLKQRLLKEGLLDERCAICGMSPEWHGMPLVLILDHENGVNDDNRLPNLRLVCPNCNSQLPTFAGRNNKNIRRMNCKECGRGLRYKGSIRCRPCNNRQRIGAGKTRKAVWPTLGVLNRRIEAIGKSGVARELGVSETAVRKMLKRMNTAETFRMEIVAQMSKL